MPAPTQPAADDVTAARELLQQCGLRATQPRLAILGVLLRATQPLDHEHVSAALRDTGTDKSTVFRALNSFVKAGIVRRLELGDCRWRYQLGNVPGPAANKPGSDVHFLCTSCGQTLTFHTERLPLAGTVAGGVVEEVILKGRCVPCTERK